LKRRPITDDVGALPLFASLSDTDFDRLVHTSADIRSAPASTPSTRAESARYTRCCPARLKWSSDSTVSSAHRQNRRLHRSGLCRRRRDATQIATRRRDRPRGVPLDRIAAARPRKTSRTWV